MYRPSHPMMPPRFHYPTLGIDRDSGNYKWFFLRSDPYDNKRVRIEDRLLRQALTDIFHERSLTGDQIKELLRASSEPSVQDSIIKQILERQPALRRIFLKGKKISLLWTAVLSSYQSSAELLVRSGADVNERCEYQWLCPGRVSNMIILHQLLQRYPSEWNEFFIELVVNHGADLQARDDGGTTALHQAVKYGRVQATELLLEKGVDVNVATYEAGETPLHLAIIEKFDKLVPMLLKRGADLQARDNFGQTALYSAVSRYRVQATKLLLEGGADVNVVDHHKNVLLFTAAVGEKADELVPLLVKHGADVTVKDDSGENVLHRLALCPMELVELARALIEKGASIHDRSRVAHQQPIHSAALHGKNELVKLFLDHGADVNAQTHKCCFPLYWAAKTKNLALLKILLKRGANIDLKTNKGRNVLHVACKRWHQNDEIIKILLDVGADMCVEDSTGNTPLGLINLPNAIHPTIRMMLKALALRAVSLQPLIEPKLDPVMLLYYRVSCDYASRAKFTRLLGSCTFFDLLTKCECQIAEFNRNPEFERNFQRYDLTYFNQYARDIRDAFEAARGRYRVVVDLEEVIDESINNILPWHLVREVALYVVNCEHCEVRRIVQKSRSNKNS